MSTPVLILVSVLGGTFLSPFLWLSSHLWHLLGSWHRSWFRLSFSPFSLCIPFLCSLIGRVLLPWLLSPPSSPSSPSVCMPFTFSFHMVAFTCVNGTKNNLSPSLTIWRPLSKREAPVWPILCLLSVALFCSFLWAIGTWAYAVPTDLIGYATSYVSFLSFYALDLLLVSPSLLWLPCGPSSTTKNSTMLPARHGSLRFLCCCLISFPLPFSLWLSMSKSFNKQCD